MFLAKVGRRNVASLRETFQDGDSLAPAVCDAELNRITTVQERDARMLNKEQMPEHKNIEKKLFWRCR